LHFSQVGSDSWKLQLQNFFTHGEQMTFQASATSNFLAVPRSLSASVPLTAIAQANLEIKPVLL